jgi:hypothetical protein
MSADPYSRTFEASLDLCKCDISHHSTGGIRFITKHGQLILLSMDPGTPGAHIDKWCTQLGGAWLILIDGHPVSTVADAQCEILNAYRSNPLSCMLLFSHPKVTPDILNRGIPVMSKDNFTQYTHDQLNNHVDLLTEQNPNSPCILRTQYYNVVLSGDVQNYTTRVMRLMCGRLIQQDDRTDWQHSKYLQLNQYSDQGCFGDPTAVEKDDAMFHLVWTYNIKALDGQKNARCVCDGSSHSGSIKVLNKVFANCVDQTSSCLFYAFAAAENLLVFGCGICNAFVEAPPPRQGFYI